MRVSPTRATPRLAAGDRHEIDVVDRALAIAIDQIDQAAADPFDRGNVQFHRPGGDRSRFCTQIRARGVGKARIGDAKRHGARARAVSARELLRKAVVLRIDDEIDVSLSCSVTFLERCRATAGNPMLSNSRRSNSGSGAAYSTNSKPSVRIGLVVFMCTSQSRMRYFTTNSAQCQSMDAP